MQVTPTNPRSNEAAIDPYVLFLARKLLTDPMTGLNEVPALPDCLFPHQRDIVAWALRRGRAALFAGTGLGKSLMELAWAQAIHQATGKDILHLAPLAVSAQMAREADKFGIAARVVTNQSECGPGTNITNYQKLEHFDLSRFGGVILDESSILKNTDGHYRTKLIEACQSIPFRLAATATPAPNDFMELGNHAEFLGIMSYTDMLATFFVHDGGDTQKWRLKGHAENEFWKWMASWAVMLRKPSDLGYPNEGYDLPPLNFEQHIVAADYAPDQEMGTLFPMQAQTLQERIAARRSTVDERTSLLFRIVIGSYCDKLAECHGSLNTPSAAAQNIKQTPKSASAVSPKAESQSETLNICADITGPIPRNSSALPNSKPKSIAAAASDTLLIENTESSASNLREAATQKRVSTDACATNTALTSNNSIDLLNSKTGSVPSASESPERTDCSLTTAMQAALSEGFFATRAIPASDISRMTQNGLIEPWCIWCNLNSEQDALAKAFGPLAFSVSGSMPDDQKEAAILAWMAGERPIMISKPQIMGFGMNFQHCRTTAFVGLNDSFEQFYQAVRRFWRFGQTKPVTAHIIASELEGATVANIRRKEADADRMAAAMVMHMADLSSQAVRGSVRETPNYNPTQPVKIPAFMEKAQ